jgi:hypothetical protein
LEQVADGFQKYWIKNLLDGVRTLDNWNLATCFNQLSDTNLQLDAGCTRAELPDLKTAAFTLALVSLLNHKW